MNRIRLAAIVIAISMAIPAVASITGTVLNHDGQPIPGARVALYAREDSSTSRARLLSEHPEPVPLSAVTTSSTGAFTLESPKDPVVRIQVEARGYAPEARSIERDETDVVFALAGAAAKQGVVTAAGKPVANAHVVVSGGGADLTAVTDASGHYSVPDPSLWASRLVIQHPASAPFEQSSTILGVLPLDASLETGVAIAGKVVASDGKSAAPNVAILLDDWPAATSAADGSFTIPHAPASWRTIEARTDTQSAVHARAGKAAMVLKLAPSGSVAGTLRDPKNNAVVGALVELAVPPSGPGRGFRFQASVSAITDAKGAFSISGVAPGTYELAVDHPAYVSPVMNVLVGPGQRVQKALAATHRARIAGVVISDQKVPVAGATVAIQEVSREPRFMRPGARNFRRAFGPPPPSFSGTDGRFVVRADTEGDYEVAATRKGMPPGRSSAMHVAAGERKNGVVVTIPRGIQLAGKVIDHDGKPVAGAVVTAAEAEGGGGPRGAMVRRMITIGGRRTSPEDQVRSSADGSFSTRVREGKYDITVTHPGFAATSLSAVTVTAGSKPVSITLEPGVEISGRVVRSGAGVVGANIFALGEGGPSSALTAADGSFTLSDLNAGAYMLNVNKQEDFIQMMRNVTAPARDVVIQLPAAGTVTGRVLDKNTHEPIPSFQAGVNMSRSGGAMNFVMPPMMQPFTSDDGSFTLQNVPVGTQTIIASAPGYTQGRVANVTVEEGKATENIEIDLDTGVRLVGHVTGPDGSPLSGVSVRDAGSGGGGGMRMVMSFGASGGVVTDANGDYTMDQLDPGQKSIQFALDPYLPVTKSVDLSGRETRLDAQLSSGLHIAGVVVSDGGGPVADASVRATSAASASGMHATQSDAGGNFSFDGLAPGHYTFTASKAGLADGNIRDFDISGGAPVRITMTGGGSIYGHVTGVAAADLASVTVSARSSAGSSSAQADSGGNYRIDGAPTGSVRVVADLIRGFGDARESGAKMVDVAAGSAIEADLVFDTSTNVQGRVTLAGAPLAGASVSFMPTSGGSRVQATTDQNGAYNAVGVADGPYNIVVFDPGAMNPYSTTYTVQGSGTFDIDIKTVSLQGHVTDAASGDPVSNAQIQLRTTGSTSTSFMSVRAATTDDSGAFTIDSVSAGEYTVTARKEGYGDDVHDVVVTDTSAPPIQLSIARNDGVTLKVVDARDGTILNPAIVVYDSAGRIVYESGYRGGTEPLTLAPGQYRAVIAANGYAPQTVTFTSPSTQTVALTPGGTIAVAAKNSDMTRRGRLIDSNGQLYTRPMVVDGTFPLSGTTSMINNIAPGAYTLQVLVNGAVTESVQVTVVDGVAVTASI